MKRSMVVGLNRSKIIGPSDNGCVAAATATQAMQPMAVLKIVFVHERTKYIQLFQH